MIDIYWIKTFMFYHVFDKRWVAGWPSNIHLMYNLILWNNFLKKKVVGWTKVYKCGVDGYVLCKNLLKTLRCGKIFNTNKKGKQQNALCKIDCFGEKLVFLYYPLFGLGGGGPNGQFYIKSHRSKICQYSGIWIANI